FSLSFGQDGTDTFRMENDRLLFEHQGDVDGSPVTWNGVAEKIGESHDSNFDRKDAFAEFAGDWAIRYANGATRYYTINADGLVEFSGEGLRGYLLRSGDLAFLHFHDGKV